MAENNLPIEASVFIDVAGARVGLSRSVGDKIGRGASGGSSARHRVNGEKLISNTNYLVSITQLITFWKVANNPMAKRMGYEG
jgi:hypothetical protein